MGLVIAVRYAWHERCDDCSVMNFGVLVLLSSSVASAAAPAPGSGVPLTRGKRALIAVARRAPGRPVRTPVAVNTLGGVDEAKLPAGIKATLGTLRQVRGYLADQGGTGFSDARIARFSWVTAIKRAGVRSHRPPQGARVRRRLHDELGLPEEGLARAGPRPLRAARDRVTPGSG